MNRAALLVLFLIASACSVTDRSSDAVDRISVDGDVGSARSWSIAELQAAFGDRMRKLHQETKRGPIELLGIPLSLLVESAHPRLAPDRKNPELSLAIAVTARDGYTVTFSHDEVVPFGNREPTVFLAVAEVDGPLPRDYGPAQIVITTPDGRARRMHSVIGVRVVDLAAER